MWFVALVELPQFAPEGHRDPVDAHGLGCVSLVLIDRAGSSHIRFEDERRLAAHRLVREEPGERNLHHRPFARHKWIDPFDLKPDFALHDDPPGASVGMQGARRLRSRRGVNVIAAQMLIIDNDFAPVGFPFVLGLEIG